MRKGYGDENEGRQMQPRFHALSPQPPREAEKREPGSEVETNVEG